jgi:hypothetical protein
MRLNTPGLAIALPHGHTATSFEYAATVAEREIGGEKRQLMPATTVQG